MTELNLGWVLGILVNLSEAASQGKRQKWLLKAGDHSTEGKNSFHYTVVEHSVIC